MRNYGYIEERDSSSFKDIHLWRRILTRSSNYWKSLGGAILLSLLVTGGTLGLPYLMQSGIDNYVIAPGLTPDSRIEGLGQIALIYGILVGVVFLGTFLQVVLLEWVGQSVMHRIRQDLFTHILTLDLPFFHGQPTGRLVTRLTNDIQNMHEMFTSVIVTLFNDLLRLAGILCVLYWMNVRLALVMTLFVPLALLITILFSRLARERFRAIRTHLAKLNSFLQESVAGISILQLFGQQNHYRNRFMTLSREYMEKNFSQIRLFSVFMPLTEFMGSLAIALILWYGGSQVIQERLSLGELVAFFTYMRLFFQPLRELAQKYSIVQSAMASAERIFQLLDTTNQTEESTQPRQLTSIKGKVRFNHVSFGYEENTPILNDINLTIDPGTTVALVGTTGSGKTTLINLLLRFYDPQQGSIEIDDIDVTDLPLAHLRQTVGVILQDIFILNDTLLTNIVMDTGKTRQEVMTILQQTGMDRFVETLPRGLDTPIGEGGQELSTGEKQLLSFARVLCRNPAILVLDEATAAVDTESENMLEQAIDDIFTTRTSLVIAHRLSTVRRADHIILMEQGEIIEQGSHAQLMDLNGSYARMVAMDLKNESPASV